MLVNKDYQNRNVTVQVVLITLAWRTPEPRKMHTAIRYTCTYAPIGRSASNVISLSVRSHISETTRPKVDNFFMRVVWGRGLVRLWRRCNVIYFRFCGWGHVFTQRTLWRVTYIPKRPEYIVYKLLDPSKLCWTIKNEYAHRLSMHRG